MGLGARQPCSQTREKAESAAIGRTGEPQAREAKHLGDHSLPLEVEVPPPCGHTGLQPVPPAPRGAFVGIPLPLSSGGWLF